MTEKMLTLSSYMAEQIAAYKDGIAFYRNALEETAKNLETCCRKLQEAEKLYEFAQAQGDDGK